MKRDGEVILEVECGGNKGLLYLGRLCQGSKGPCILFKGTWLTPNEFQYVSGRETAKDWKRSIRHSGKSMKLLLAKGVLSVHPPVCECAGCRTQDQQQGHPPPTTQLPKTPPDLQHQHQQQQQQQQQQHNLLSTLSLNELNCLTARNTALQLAAQQLKPLAAAAAVNATNGSKNSHAPASQVRASRPRKLASQRKIPPASGNSLKISAFHKLQQTLQELGPRWLWYGKGEIMSLKYFALVTGIDKSLLQRVPAERIKNPALMIFPPDRPVVDPRTIWETIHQPSQDGEPDSAEKSSSSGSLLSEDLSQALLSGVYQNLYPSLLGGLGALGVPVGAATPAVPAALRPPTAALAAALPHHLHSTQPPAQHLLSLPQQLQAAAAAQAAASYFLNQTQTDNQGGVVSGLSDEVHEASSKANSKSAASGGRGGQTRAILSSMEASLSTDNNQVNHHQDDGGNDHELNVDSINSNDHHHHQQQEKQNHFQNLHHQQQQQQLDRRRNVVESDDDDDDEESEELALRSRSSSARNSDGGAMSSSSILHSQGKLSSIIDHLLGQTSKGNNNHDHNDIGESDNGVASKDSTPSDDEVEEIMECKDRLRKNQNEETNFQGNGLNQ
ncbi:uncharacterized protein LOC108863881 [Galendromus occidentalis]|uniref:Uncharacterized protein LOC108863881 n=1 Tax=Galendromus occidentalis TaxID=34638 RepID=A0AAJ7WGU5_9ACAR|nr:uncharacterized protein LOC108863881 [Galendromus occidentalis]